MDTKQEDAQFAGRLIKVVEESNIWGDRDKVLVVFSLVDGTIDDSYIFSHPDNVGKIESLHNDSQQKVRAEESV